ncbi:MAG: hypothetical protein ACRDJW_09155, partial [Thermomicrobiales bacterium]
MATHQRRAQPVPASHGATGHRTTAIEAAELELADVHASTPFKPHGIHDTPFPTARRPLDAASVLAQQRTHGNAFVGRLIARGIPGSPGAEADANAAALGSAGSRARPQPTGNAGVGPPPHGDDATRSSA